MLAIFLETVEWFRSRQWGELAALSFYEEIYPDGLISNNEQLNAYYAELVLKQVKEDPVISTEYIKLNLKGAMQI